ncbi:hypothetical protein C2G38_2159467 [Gigaspora rosea]|uniref:Uncharacterized protein n=1 Tax=Gigaspora rosea TaxID=44941 RepID=A0A397W1B6_9GLOM|nr:hypothetical protein C2G38_2159467 [Gigaspora rosea]
MIRCYDYPLITFNESSFPRINSDNNPWNNTSQYNSIEVEESKIISHDIRALVSNQYTIIEGRKEELKADIKIYKTLIKIMTKNINNDKLFEAYKTFKQPIIDETIACIEALNMSNSNGHRNHQEIKN